MNENPLAAVVGGPRGVASVGDVAESLGTAVTLDELLPDTETS
jgi:hypothetical protein